MIRTFAALAAVALAAWACTVNTKSDALACKTTADCSNGRTCHAGYCVTDGPIDATNIDAKPIDAAVCPPECASCDFPTGTCNLNGSGSATACPTSWNCTFTCTDAAPCGDITCGAGACLVSCTGSGACGAISCASSCKCDVACNPVNGACGTMSCPVKPGNKYCTATGLPGGACDSGRFAQCRTCP